MSEDKEPGITIITGGKIITKTGKEAEILQKVFFPNQKTPCDCIGCKIMREIESHQDRN